MKTLTVRLQRKCIEAEDIVSLELVSPEGGPLPALTAGAHIDLHIRPGLIRQYSLYNDPEERQRYLIGVLRDPASRGGSIAIHDDLTEGDLLEISEPRNLFPLVRARRHLLFGGGIGITPMLCMAARLARIGADFELHYCARSLGRMAFRDHIAASNFADQAQYHFDDGDEAQQLDLYDLLEVPDGSTHIYVCGPAGFIDHVCRSADAFGWPAENVHFEYFGVPALDTSGDTAFDVEIASTGETINVPAGHSVADLLLQHGIELDVSCRQGVCGTCVTGVLEGTPEHRDLYLSAEDKAKSDQFTPCCSRARSKVLVLDL